MKREKVLVFGGLGFIGKNFLSALDLNLFEPVVVDVRDSAEGESIYKYIPTGKTSKQTLESYLSEASYVIDFAYATNPKTSFEDPINDIQLNLPRVVELLQLASNSKSLKNVIITSSGGTVYGQSDHRLISEKDETNPISPYGITKLAIEKYAQMYHVQFGIPITIVRPSNPYGPGQKPYQGQGFISAAIARILKGEPINVFGENGTIRDYIYISDLVSALIKIMVDGTPGEIYNIGTGVGRTNLEVVEAISTVMDSPVLIETSPSRKFDVKSNVLDSSKLRKVTGWEQQVSFEEGLIKTADWVKQYLRDEHLL